MQVLIPSIGHSDMLSALLQTLHWDPAVEQVFVVDNQHNPVELAAWTRNLPDLNRVSYHSAPGATLYKVWNAGMEASASVGDGWLVILNDDVWLPNNAISAVAQFVQRNPAALLVGFDWRTRDPRLLASPIATVAVGTIRRGGIPGFGFAIQTRAGVRVDEQFEWWGGDDDLVYSMRQQYGDRSVLLANGIPIQHPHPETSAVHYEHLGAAKDRDRQRLFDKWGETW